VKLDELPQHKLLGLLVRREARRSLNGLRCYSKSLIAGGEESKRGSLGSRFQFREQGRNELKEGTESGSRGVKGDTGEETLTGGGGRGGHCWGSWQGGWGAALPGGLEPPGALSGVGWEGAQGCLDDHLAHTQKEKKRTKKGVFRGLAGRGHRVAG